MWAEAIGHDAGLKESELIVTPAVERELSNGAVISI
jgi:hypothetical protein